MGDFAKASSPKGGGGGVLVNVAGAMFYGLVAAGRAQHQTNQQKQYFMHK